MNSITELQINTLEEYLIENINLLQELIEEKGMWEKVKENNDFALLFNFSFFAITKGVRSLKAAHLLAEEGFFEDILILLRSSYESYLHISFLKKNPNQIHRLTTLKLLIKDKKLEHPKNKKQEDIKHKVINPENGKEEILSYSLKKISQNTMSETDGEIYDDLYMFLSEFSHVNFLAVGTFISSDEKIFTLKSKPSVMIFQTIILQLFVSWLLLESTSLFIPLNKKEKKKIDNQIKMSGMILHNYILNFEIEDKRIINLKDNLINRLNETLKFYR